MGQIIETKAVTVPFLRKQKGVKPITMLTAYDYPTARLLDEAGVDVLLVGDSAGTVLAGESNTLSVTLDQMVMLTQWVSRGAHRALVIGDLPFMSYQISPEQALRSAARLIQEGRAQAVKLEGGLEMAETVRALTRAGIPVCGHIGLTPQSIHSMGTYRMHGKSESERTYLLESARALADAGAFLLVLECITPGLADEITGAVSIPTIGIGSGPQCDGQVLVIHDLVGLTSGKVPRFARPTAQLGEQMKNAVAEYLDRTQREWTPPSPAKGTEDHVVSH